MSRRIKNMSAACAGVMLALVLSACGAQENGGITAATPIPTPVPVTAAELLADALMHYDAGDYEEAIIAYLGVIEIEPNNFDAQLGLGKAYRSAGKTEEAEAALLTAWEIEGENWEAAYELSYLYLESGKYEEAETVAASFWDADREDTEIGIALVLSLAGQGKAEELQALITGNENLQDALLITTEEDIIYIGEYDANGQRSGQGVGLYPGGYVYVGEYENGQRSGQGVWHYPGGAYYTGSWADDLPNGTGELVGNAVSGVRKTGTWKNGLEHGEMENWFIGNPEIHDNSHLGHWKYLAEEGSPIPQYERYGFLFFAECLECGGLNWSGAYIPMGLSPFVDEYDKTMMLSDERTHSDESTEE